MNEELPERELAHVRALQDEFVSRVSHELRTPLAAIKASIGVVLANEPPETPDVIHRLLTNIDVAAEQMSHMVANLLELARLSAGRVELRPGPSDLRSVVLQAITGIEALAHRRGQHIETDLPDIPCAAPTDPPRIERALVNVLSNAIRYGRANGTIRVSLMCDGSEALLSVFDDGPGVPESECGRIFERARSESQGMSGGHGIGLGLPIAMAMVELHGGRIWCESPPDGGGCFRIALPMHTLSPSPPGNSQREGRLAPLAATGLGGGERMGYTEGVPQAHLGTGDPAGERSAGEEP